MKTTLNQKLLLSIAGLMLAINMTPALAADTPSPAVEVKAKSVDPLDAIRLIIKKEHWEHAITELKKQAETPDVNNLLGYTHRKSGKLDQALVYYDKALKANPNHLGALEYQGEAFLMKRELEQAKGNLARLKTLCGGKCEEYEDLNKAIQRYK